MKINYISKKIIYLKKLAKNYGLDLEKEEFAYSYLIYFILPYAYTAHK